MGTTGWDGTGGGGLGGRGPWGVTLRLGAWTQQPSATSLSVPDVAEPCQALQTRQLEMGSGPLACSGQDTESRSCGDMRRRTAQPPLGHKPS